MSPTLPTLQVNVQQAITVEGEGMFGGKFKHSVPDTLNTMNSVPPSDRESRKQALKDEINKCMRQLEIDENNNPNDATSITAKSERPPMNMKPVNGVSNLLAVKPQF